MTALHGSLLYEAATNSLASDASSDNCWTKMVQASFPHSGCKETFKQELKDVEKTIKDEYKLTSMPSPWRSAKSVVMATMSKDIKLVDDNGNILGKTFIQNKIKDTKEEVVEDAYHKAHRFLIYSRSKLHEITDIMERITMKRLYQEAADSITDKL